MLVVLILMTLGIVMIFSASQVIAERKHDSTFYFLFQQLIRVGLGLVILVFAAKYDYHNYINKAMLILLITAVLLIVVLGIGKIKGAARWLSVGGMGIQPSEIAKLGIIFYLSTYLSRKGDRIKDLQNGLMPPLIMTGAFSFLIILQPNFSTAMILMGMAVILLFIGGMRMRHLALLVSAVIPIGLILAIASPYRMARLMTYMNPEQDMQGMGYQIKQSLISFGNGGLFGVGIGSGKQKLLFLPEPFTDFIYSIIGEEFGLLGTLAILVLFGVFLFRAVKIARHAPDMYGFYLAAGITVSVVLYALINAAVTVGLIPTTGLPMPFISYGGSSMLFTCFAVGILLNISSQTVPKELAMQSIHEQTDTAASFSERMNVFQDDEPVPEKPVKKKPATKPKIGGDGSNLVGMDFS
jgi:cell division protein FtsW